MIGPLILTAADDTRQQFEPLYDITPHETALILSLLFKLSVNRDATIPDWRGYLVEHKLERHFKPIEEDKP
jgi:hypothetical protein